MPDIRIREYRPDDVTALIDLFRGAIRTTALRDYSASQVLAWAPDEIDPEVFARRRASKQTWVAEINGQIAGFVDLESDGHIDMLYVHAEHQRKGIARTLLDHIEKAANHSGLDRLYTEASITARPSFERGGFQVITTQNVTINGETLTNYRMEKRIGESSSK